MKLVVLSFLAGDLTSGFPEVTAQIWHSRNDFPSKIGASLPPAPILLETYQQWREFYISLQGFFSLRIKVLDRPTVSHLSESDFKHLCHQLSGSLNQWLNTEEFQRLEKQLRTQLNADEEILVLIETKDEMLRYLPWHLWSFWEDYPQAELGLACAEYYPVPETHNGTGGRARILAVLGDATNINVDADRQYLEMLPNAEIQFLIEPALEELQSALWDSQGWDVFFFAGHSSTQQQQGYLHLNPTPQGSITISQLKYALRRACDRGLQLAIFNSCDGLGLAAKLADLQIPQTIVMKEPVPDPVAQVFLKCFLAAFAGGRSLTSAMREARERLQSLEPKFICASWLPVLYQNPATSSKLWQELGRSAIAVNACPYRGLLAFREEDAPFFQGRETLTQTLLQAVKERPLTAVIGASGIGKSSLVFAGLVPCLKASGNWQIIQFRPGKHPLSALVAALTTQLNLSDGVQTVEQLTQQLQEEASLLGVWLAQWFQQTNSFVQLLIAIDQFEEVYTLTENPTERQSFIQQILDLVKHNSLIRVVLTLRADFFIHALSDRDLADALQHADLKVGPMNRSELEAAITQPATFMGVRFEEGLIERILDAIANEPANLALLEFTLTQLWEKRSQGQLTHVAYQEIGCLTEALSRYAQQVYDQLTPKEKQAARWIFLSLIQVNETLKDTRRQVEQADLFETESQDIVKQVLQKLTAAKLVVTNHVNRDSEVKIVVDLAHEALIRHWSLLRYWVEENQQILGQAQRLEWEAKLWVEQGQLNRKEYLFQGVKLQQAQEFVKKYGSRVVLSAKARELIQTSLSWQKRQRLTVAFAGSSLAAAVLSILGFWAVYQYNWYWNETIKKVQTVDFNILHHFLPHKLSAALSVGDSEEVNKILNSNYGLFGLVVTDCKVAAQNCPDEKIVYATFYQKRWHPRLSVKELSGYSYDILRNPPPLYTEQHYLKTSDLQPQPTGKVNQGEIIGRVYYIRRHQSTFRVKVFKWLF